MLHLTDKVVICLNDARQMLRAEHFDGFYCQKCRNVVPWREIEMSEHCALMTRKEAKYHGYRLAE